MSRTSEPTIEEYVARGREIVKLKARVQELENGESWKAACESARIASATIDELTRERDMLRARAKPKPVWANDEQRWEFVAGVVADGGSLGREVCLGAVAAAILWADREISRLRLEMLSKLAADAKPAVESKQSVEAAVQEWHGHWSANFMSLAKGMDRILEKLK